MMKVLEMCKRLMEKKDCKLLVIGHQFMHTHFINVNGKPVTEQEAIDYYAKQGVYFFFKHYRYVLCMCTCVHASVCSVVCMHCVLGRGEGACVHAYTAKWPDSTVQ